MITQSPLSKPPMQRFLHSPAAIDGLSMPTRNWFAAGLSVVAFMTLYRVGFLWIDSTDLFVDESQYWLWSRDLDFGYYSKPPLIAWVIRLFTELAQSDAVFWVRLPAPLFHCATAVILGVLGRFLYGTQAAFWVMLSYITMPAVSLGSAVISTDTIMAPFFSAALLFYFRMLDTRQLGYAVLAGLCAGVAFLAKYAGIYFLLGALLAAVFIPAARPSWRNALAVLAAFVAVALPNIVWNLQNDLSTFEHTLDNAAWVRQGAAQFDLHFLELGEFFFSQFGVFGPILFATLIAAAFRARFQHAGTLLFFSVPVVLIVCAQALLSRAYANWAAAAYFGGTVLVVAALLEQRYLRLLKTSFWIGLVAAVALPVLTSIAPAISVDGEKPAMKRLLGREQLSREIIDAARAGGADIIVNGSRDIVADLFYTGRDLTIPIRMIAPPGRPKNYYQLKFPFRGADAGQTVLLVGHEKGWTCGDRSIAPYRTLTTEGGAYHGSDIHAFLLDSACIDDAGQPQ